MRQRGPTLAQLLLACILFMICAGGARAGNELDQCFATAARYHHVNPLILRGISWQESHNNPNALNRNTNGTVDYGLMQINSQHLHEPGVYRISVDTLMRPCESIFIAAWYLRRMMDRYGNTWTAVGSYHSQTPDKRDGYSGQILAILRRWGAFTLSSAAQR